MARVGVLDDIELEETFVDTFEDVGAQFAFGVGENGLVARFVG